VAEISDDTARYGLTCEFYVDGLMIDRKSSSPPESATPCPIT
jgi:hypothetical protein